MSARDRHLAQSLPGRQTSARRTGLATVLFKPVTLFALIAIGVFSFGALLVLGGFANDLRKTAPGQATPRSVSAVGYKALQDYMNANGYVAHETRDDRSYYVKQNQLVILTPSAPFSRLNSRVEDPTDNEVRLIVLPKWAVSQMVAQQGEETGTGWARKRTEDGLYYVGRYDYLLDDMPVVKRIEKISQNIDIGFMNGRDRGLPDSSDLDIDSLQYFDLEARWVDYNIILREIFEAEREAERKREAEERGETYEPPKKKKKKDDKEEKEETEEPGPLPDHQVVMRIDGHAVLIRMEDSRTFLLSEPDLLNTMAFQTQTSARIALGVVDEVLVEAGAELYHADFDVSLHGIESNRNLIKLMVTPPFLAATLCLLLAGGLVAWQGFNRFGDPARTRPDYTQGPVSLAETAAEFMEVANRTHKTGEAYAAMIRRQVVAELGYKGRTEERVEKLLDGREKRLEISPSYAELKTKIGTATPQSYGQYARALAQWRDRMIATDTPQKDPTS